MRGNLRPITPRSSPAIARPAAAPKGSSRPRGATNAMTQAQPNESARWTGMAASSRRPRRVSPGSRIEPAASDASSRSPPRSSATAVEGAPARTAAHPPAAIPSRSVPRGVLTPTGSPGRTIRTGGPLEVLWRLGGDRLDQLAGLALRGMGGNVGLGDDAGQPLVVVHDAQALDGLLAHHSERLVERRVGGDPVHRALGELATRGAGRIAALGERLHDDVAVGEHALEAIVIAADRQHTDIELRHPLRRVEQRLVLADALTTFVHGLTDRAGGAIRHCDTSSLAVGTRTLLGSRSRGKDSTSEEGKPRSTATAQHRPAPCGAVVRDNRALRA